MWQISALLIFIKQVFESGGWGGKCTYLFESATLFLTTQISAPTAKLLFFLDIAKGVKHRNEVFCVLDIELCCRP
jgi:hypothetical protein